MLPEVSGNVTFIISANLSTRVWNITYQQMSEKISENIENLKKYKDNHFFQFFKHLKQQQHQTNTMLHKYENKMDYKY
jgi:hypothetical protein